MAEYLTSELTGSSDSTFINFTVYNDRRNDYILQNLKALYLLITHVIWSTELTENSTRMLPSPTSVQVHQDFTTRSKGI